MSSVDRGTGSPVVLIPGIQGRWEWMTPTIAALGRTHRVLSFSLSDVDQSSDHVFDRWMSHIDDLLERAGERTATVIGVSFGGLVASCYAARRPGAVTSLVLAATPSPHLHREPRITTAIRNPWLVFPAFVLGSAQRLSPEIIASHDTWSGRAAFAGRYATRALRSPVSPVPMAAWVRAWMAEDIAGECRTIAAPTLVITGEPGLDRVVPVHSTLEYLSLIAGAERRTLPRTGHLGFVTRPDEFAALVTDFIAACATRADARSSASQRVSLSGRAS